MLKDATGKVKKKSTSKGARYALKKIHTKEQNVKKKQRRKQQRKK